MTTGAGWGGLILRCVLGVIYVMHGYLAYMVLWPRGVAAYVLRLGFPFGLTEPLAWYLIVVHTVGGIMLILGLATRVVALLNVPIMLCAIFVIHLPQGFFMKSVVDTTSSQVVAVGYEFPLLVLGATLALALMGGGAFALDLMFRRPPGRRR